MLDCPFFCFDILLLFWTSISLSVLSADFNCRVLYIWLPFADLDLCAGLVVVCCVGCRLLFCCCCYLLFSCCRLLFLLLSSAVLVTVRRLCCLFLLLSDACCHRNASTVSVKTKDRFSHPIFRSHLQSHLGTLPGTSLLVTQDNFVIVEMSTVIDDIQ